MSNRNQRIWYAETDDGRFIGVVRSRNRSDASALIAAGTSKDFELHPINHLEPDTARLLLEGTKPQPDLNHD